MLPRCQSFVRLVVVVCLGLLGAASAHAARYVGAWDPLYGADIGGNATGDLGWRGFALFDVPGVPGCLASDSCATGASLINAEVTFFDVNTPAVDLAKVTWPDGSLNDVTVNLILDDDIQPVQFDTSAFPPLPPVPVAPFGPGLDGPYGNFLDFDFSLEFAIDFLEAGIDGPVLRWRQAGCDLDCASGFNDVRGNPAVLVVTKVPEPAGLALMATALLAAGAARRRTKAKSSGPRDRRAIA